MLRRILLRLLFLLQVHRLLRHFQRRRVLVLMYHGFARQHQVRGPENHEGNHVHVGDFRNQVRYLSKHHRVISLEDLVEARTRGTPLPDHAVVITMDDGYRSAHALAFPILREYGVPAAVFVTTGFVENREPLWPDRAEWALGAAAPGTYDLEVGGENLRLDLRDDVSRRQTARALFARLKALPQENLPEAVRAVESCLGQSLARQEPRPQIYEPLGWDEIRDMAASGLVAFGNHTHTHVILSRCGAALQREEISRAARLLAERAGIHSRLFCYPNGGPDDFDDTTRALLAEMGYTCSLTTVPGFNDETTPLLELRRYAVHDGLNLDEFVIVLYGGLRQFLRDLLRSANADARH
jgi:peptidoglycan/xylan/chitin deacetylase (PgdA/CDA1 family)